MRIEIPPQGRMALTGSGMINLIQNNHMPLLDLLVRESIQNSLDATLPDVDYVNVEFERGEFKQKEFAALFDGIEDTLLQKYSKEQYPYLMIRDTNTKGLMGPLHFSIETKEKERDLLKLIYEIAKPQEAEGAGGSWGLGKTIYFRVGEGLVLYYSRTRTEKGFQSRLAACLVENEKKKDCLLRNMASAKRGLAWWGEEFEYYEGPKKEIGTIPITDEDEIDKVLSVLGIEPFGEYQTGTAIVIPYINEKKLLKDNISQDDVMWHPYWLDSMDDYLNVAVQRWYAARLMNNIYKIKNSAPFLRVLVNGRGIKQDSMLPTFSTIQKLYNSALVGNKVPEIDCLVEPININKLFKDKCVGHIAFGVFDSESLKMLAPNNFPNPYECIKNRGDGSEYLDGKIIISYFRKPGMAVNYEMSGEWVKGLKGFSKKEDDILIGTFVLNSNNKFDPKGQHEDVEAYFRSSENADHNCWHDISDDNNPRILEKIQTSVRKKIKDAYKTEEESTENHNSVLSRLFGDILMPPDGFGKKARMKPRGQSTKVKNPKTKGVSLVGNDSDAVIRDGKMYLPMHLCITKPVDFLRIPLEIAMDGNANLELCKWEKNTGTNEPFSINHITISNSVVRGMKYDGQRKLTCEDKELKLGDLQISIDKLSSGMGHSVICSSNTPITFEFDLRLSINIYDRTTQLCYSVKGGEQ